MHTDQIGEQIESYGKVIKEARLSGVEYQIFFFSNDGFSWKKYLWYVHYCYFSLMTGQSNLCDCTMLFQILWLEW